METVSGISNWILTFERRGEGIALLRALTCDPEAELPADIHGIPVTEICENALSVQDFTPDGETIRISCGIPYGDFDNRNLRILTLPEKLKRIGRYAFYNCRSLSALRFSDGIEFLGASAFMNCLELNRLDIARTGDGQGMALASIVSGLTHEIEARVISADGREARFVFPEYRELRIENEPTHFFSYAIEGAGYPYHSVFRKKQFSASEFDGLWERYLASDFEEPTALKLAWLRVRYPLELSEAACGRYISYLNSHTEPLFRMLTQEKDAEGIRIVLGKCDLSREALDFAGNTAAENGFTEASVMILEKRHELFPPAGRKKYEF